MFELWEVEADGKTPGLGKTAATDDGDLKWSLDGKKVAYVHQVDGRRTIYVDDFSGKATNLTPLDRENAPEGWAFAPPGPGTELGLFDQPVREPGHYGLHSCGQAAWWLG